MSAEKREQITVFVHGTFGNPWYDDPEARPSSDALVRPWWRLAGEGEEPTMADRVREILDGIDPSLADTVWYPGSDPRDGDLSYRDVGEWSGTNSHKARRQAARDLARALRTLADRRGCGPERPLMVNFVAHSHGGNVVLESLHYLGDEVSPRQVCMLGTPLTWRFFDPRLFYLVYILPLYVLLLDLAEPYWQGYTASVTATTWSVQWLTGWGIFFLVLTPVFLWLVALLHRVFRRAFGLLPWDSPAYGPRPEELERKLRGRPAVLFISPEDEADLMLQLGAAPIDAYRAIVRNRPTLRGGRTVTQRLLRVAARYVELAFVRPLSYAGLIPIVEILLERIGLGFSLMEVLFFNHEMVTWTGARTYEDKQILTKHVSEHALRKRVLRVELSESPIPAGTRSGQRPGSEDDKERIDALRGALIGTLSGLKSQVRLRHSGYYESGEVIEQVALAIAAEGPATAA